MDGAFLVVLGDLCLLTTGYSHSGISPPLHGKVWWIDCLWIHVEILDSNFCLFESTRVCMYRPLQVGCNVEASIDCYILSKIIHLPNSWPIGLLNL